MDQLFDKIKAKIRQKDKMRIAFPEALDERILTAACQLSHERLLTPVLIGEWQKIDALAKKLNLDSSLCEVINPNYYDDGDDLVRRLIEQRNGKVSESEAKEILLDVNYFGTMLTLVGEVDGLVSGAVHSTADTVRPALQLIKTKQCVKRASGAFLLTRNEERYIFADCAINIAPTSEDLAEIAIESYETAKLFNINPRLALLSFSTKGSAQSKETEKVIQALQIVKNKRPDLVIDGEFQFDAAFVPSIAAKKTPESKIGGQANVFIFPSLEAGNIGYKIADHLGQFETIGSILQGLNKPVNDLSRGCRTEEVYKLALITALQAGKL